MNKHKTETLILDKKNFFFLLSTFLVAKVLGFFPRSLFLLTK